MARTQWADEIMVRLDEDGVGVLQALQTAYPGLNKVDAIRKAMREAMIPPDILLRYRKPPLFPEWLSMGPLSPIAADDRGQRLRLKGFEVEVQQVEPKRPVPLWDPEDETPPEDDDLPECEECGSTLDTDRTCPECRDE